MTVAEPTVKIEKRLEDCNLEEIRTNPNLKKKAVDERPEGWDAQVWATYLQDANPRFKWDTVHQPVESMKLSLFTTVDLRQEVLKKLGEVGTEEMLDIETNLVDFQTTSTIGDAKAALKLNDQTELSNVKMSTIVLRTQLRERAYEELAKKGYTVVEMIQYLFTKQSSKREEYMKCTFKEALDTVSVQFYKDTGLLKHEMPVLPSKYFDSKNRDAIRCVFQKKLHWSVKQFNTYFDGLGAGVYIHEKLESLMEEKAKKDNLKRTSKVGEKQVGKKAKLSGRLIHFAFMLTI
jgi:hypothetical protein